jgi:hypothetical protein
MLCELRGSGGSDDLKKLRTEVKQLPIRQGYGEWDVLILPAVAIANFHSLIGEQQMVR